MEPMESFIKGYDTFMKDKSRQAFDSFLKAFREVVNKKVWFRFPMVNCDTEPSHGAVLHKGELYVVMFTREENVNLYKDMGLAMMDINDGIRAVYANPLFRGLAVDPFTMNGNLYLNLKQLHVFTGVPNPRNREFDWGKGIPSFGEKDLMTRSEVLDFGIDYLESCLIMDGYEISCDSYSPFEAFNIGAEKDGKVYFIKVKSELADIKHGNPQMPKLTEEEKSALVAFAKGNGGLPRFAAISIGSDDEERLKENIALCGDKYKVRYTGLEEIEQQERTKNGTLC